MIIKIITINMIIKNTTNTMKQQPSSNCCIMIGLSVVLMMMMVMMNLFNDAFNMFCVFKLGF